MIVITKGTNTISENSSVSGRSGNSMPVFLNVQFSSQKNYVRISSFLILKTCPAHLYYIFADNKRKIVYITKSVHSLNS
jgi:hypothetical protein